MQIFHNISFRILKPPAMQYFDPDIAPYPSIRPISVVFNQQFLLYEFHVKNAHPFVVSHNCWHSLAELRFPRPGGCG